MFDLKLFKELNEEYESRPLVSSPMRTDPKSLATRAEQRTKRMQRQLDLKPGQRVLEIGCGRGHLAGQIAERYSVHVVGVDIEKYDAWSSADAAQTTFIASDIVEMGAESAESFDAAYSISVWEHIEHPAAALEAAYRVLKPGGLLFFQAQLYAGPKASHRYREVFFPWPHLLFEDAVFGDYYESIGMSRKVPAYLNRWTDMHYRFHADRVGFESLWWTTPNPLFDEEFYERFRERLSPFPVWDLSHDAVIVRLRKPTEQQPNSAHADEPPSTSGKRSFIDGRVDQNIVSRTRTAGKSLKRRASSAIQRWR